MRIVNRQQFMALPEGTVFCKYETFGIFTSLSIKGQTVHGDYCFQNLEGPLECANSDQWATLVNAAEKNGSELNLDFYCMDRDGSFDEHQRFAVYSEDEVRTMIARLTGAIYGMKVDG